MIIKGILFIIIFPLILVLLGDKFLRYVGWNRSLPASFIWGYVLILALFQFIAFPLFRLNSSFSLLFWIITLLIGSSIIWIIIEIVYKQKKSKEFVFKTYKQGIIVFFRNCRLYPFLAVLLLLCILFCIFMSEGFYYSSSDEGYNIPRALETIAQNSLGINDVLSWRGIYTNDAAPYSNASTYYFFIAWLSCIFGIHTTVLYKTFLLFILIFLHLSAVCTMYNSVKPNHSFPEKTVFIIFYILFQMLCVKPSSAGTWMTGYLYEGKATMIAIVFPLLLSTCTNIMRTIRNSGINSKREWLAVTIVLTAGIELSIVGIFLPVILYFCFGAAFLIGTKFQYFSKIILPAILSTVPVIICGIFVISPALTLFSDSEEIIVNSTTQIITHHNSILLLFSSWKSHFLEAIDFWQLILFLGGAVYYSFHGSQIEKILFVLSPLVLLLTFLNPFLCGIVSKYITTPIVYWRLWGLLPIYFVPSSAITDIFNRLSEGKIQKTLLICLQQTWPQ